MNMRPSLAGTIRGLTRLFAVIGLAASAMLATGIALDIRAIDQTRGAYDPPYTNYTGEPIDWRRMDTTGSGMMYRGRVVDLLVDCRSGMMTFDVFGFEKPWRAFSARALVVHKPREECQARGFAPEF